MYHELLQGGQQNQNLGYLRKRIKRKNKRKWKKTKWNNVLRWVHWIQEYHSQQPQKSVCKLVLYEIELLVNILY